VQGLIEKSKMQPFKAHLLPLVTKLCTSYIAATEAQYEQFFLELADLSEDGQLPKIRGHVMQTIVSFDIRLYDFTRALVELQNFKIQLEQRLLKSCWKIL
jgi:hypothetical protein